MREKDKITGLFRSRLTGAEMTVRKEFWEELQRDLPHAAAADNESVSGSLPMSAAAGGQKWVPLTPRFYRVAAAASVVFVLGVASATFWYFSPKEEIKEAFTQVAAMTPEGSLKGDVVQENFPSIHRAEPTANKPGIKQSANGLPAGLTADTEEESVSFHVSITITQRVYSDNNRLSGNVSPVTRNSVHNDTYQTGIEFMDTDSDVNSAVSVHDNPVTSQAESIPRPRNWAIKAAIGTSFPKGHFDSPFTVGVTVERSLNKFWALEAGLQYTFLPAAGRTLHTLAVPVELNAILASSPKVDFYATVGGIIEKCIAGASYNRLKAEPIQLSVAAGIGIRYKVNDRFALFAEPSASHYFDTASQTRTLRTERPVNLNLLCGVRMTY